jgi:hypothetical protein
MYTDQSLIKDNLQFLETDIFIHNVLLVLGGLISACFFYFQFFCI